MAVYECSECGYPLKGNENVCPECGNPLSKQNFHKIELEIISADNSIENVLKIDLGQYLYESFMIAKHTFWEKFFCFNGRATRREFWSFYFFGIAIPLSFYLLFPVMFIMLILAIFPAIGVSVRRLHDNGRSGWWCVIFPMAYFFYLQKNNPNPNQYGNPEPPKF